MTIRIAVDTLRVPVLALSFFVATASSCAQQRDRDADSLDALLQSADSAAVYNAGVEAFRAKRFAVARALWHRAADLADHEAESNLGFLLYYGRGGPADSLLAAEYWRRAMRGQDAEAHRHVAQAIIDGDSRLGTRAQAYSHATAARAIAGRPGQLAGDKVAQEANQLLLKLRAELPRADVAAAEETGVKWSSRGGYP